MTLRALLFVVCLMFSLLSATAIAQGAEQVKRQPVASWVIARSVEVPDSIPMEDIDGGVYYVLTDNQIRVSEQKETAYYSHYAELIVNQQGLDSGSQVNVEFDPVYESIVFNSLNIIRDGKVIDKLVDAQISVIQRETELENQIYDGTLTANILIDDLRVGDVIDYSYTLIGDNPVYEGKFAYRRYVEWSVPLFQQYIRLVWQKDKPLYVTKLNTDITVQEQVNRGIKEYQVKSERPAPKTTNSEAPEWYDPYGVVFFSESKDWGDVVSWSLPLYERAIGSNQEVIQLANKIRIESADPRVQVVKALEFVQSEVRYLGIEMGVNSHRPSMANETLSRRYGDCKDKAVLFISILKQLGVRASPALVNTERTRQLINFPPTVDAFNHVIVKVWVDDDVFWLDPTRQYQTGLLEGIYQPDYRYALVLDRNNDALEAMSTQQRSSSLVFEDHFDLSKGGGKEVIFTTRSDYTGYEAEGQRYRIADQGLNGIQERYLEFHRDYYSDLEAIEKLSFTDDTNSGHLILNEKYRLNQFWETNADDKKLEASFYANSISPFLSKPEQLKRVSPYALTFPKRYKHTIEVLFGSDGWYFESEEIVEDNEFFYYKTTANYDEAARVLTLVYEYEARTDHVEVADIDAYMAARERALESTEYPIYQSFSAEGSELNTQESAYDIRANLIIGIVLVYILGITFAFINWRLDARKQPQFDDMVFYPVSLVKLIFLTIATLGIYPIYWFYRNWLYVKEHEKRPMMPIARGIFNFLWYYPLYRRLVEDSEGRHQRNLVLATPIAIFFAAAYFLIAFSERVDYAWLPMLFVSPLLILPLANYINHIETDCPEAYRYNSRWLLRHSIVGVLLIPFMVLIYGQELNVLPGATVVDGSRLWQHDVKFMHRKDVFPANEKVDMFYSDALLSIREDGNGFTEKSVFSYWNDENGILNVENEALAQVKDINVQYSTDSVNTTITIVKADDSDFVLYVSSQDGLDKTFTTKLMKRWNQLKE